MISKCNEGEFAEFAEFAEFPIILQKDLQQGGIYRILDYLKPDLISLDASNFLTSIY